MGEISNKNTFVWNAQLIGWTRVEERAKTYYSTADRI